MSLDRDPVVISDSLQGRDMEEVAEDAADQAIARLKMFARMPKVVFVKLISLSGEMLAFKVIQDKTLRCSCS